MLIILSKHLSFLMTHLRYFYEILSSLGVDKLLHLLIAIMNSFLEKEFHGEYYLDGRSSNKDSSAC